MTDRKQGFYGDDIGTGMESTPPFWFILLMTLSVGVSIYLIVTAKCTPEINSAQIYTI